MVFCLACGVVLVALAFGEVNNDPGTTPDGPDCPVGDVVKIVLGLRPP